MTVAELLERVSSKELTEWLAYYGLEPFGAERNDLGHAITASTIANANRGKQKRPFKVEEFMPKFDKPKGQTPEQMIQFAAMMTAAGNGVLTEE
jgi:hypothetical protein